MASSPKWNANGDASRDSVTIVPSPSMWRPQTAAIQDIPSPPLLVGPPSPLRANPMQPSRKYSKSPKWTRETNTRSVSTGVQPGSHCSPAHLSHCTRSPRFPCRLSLNQRSSHLTLGSLLSCSHSDSWHPQSDIGTHRLWCHLKLLGLFSGRLAPFCN